MKWREWIPQAVWIVALVLGALGREEWRRDDNGTTEAPLLSRRRRGDGVLLKNKSKKARKLAAATRGPPSPKPLNPAQDMLPAVDDVTFGGCVAQEGVKYFGERLEGVSPKERFVKYTFHKEWKPKRVYEGEALSLVQSLDAPTGLASHCDWVIGSRLETWSTEAVKGKKKVPHFTAWGDPNAPPRTVFVQTDELEAFSQSLLRCFPLDRTFVLIIGDHDKTTPRQLDARWRPVLNPGTWQSWLADVRVAHLFVEHLDVRASTKVSAIPVGINPEEFAWSPRPPRRSSPYAPADWPLRNAPRTVDVLHRPLRALVAHRNWGGPQFTERQTVAKMCDEADWCDHLETVERSRYARVVSEYSFVLCVHGGGLDPNPKLFTALMAGAIPIMRHFPGAPSLYDGWPVVRVASWTLVTLDRLDAWRRRYAPFFHDPHLRNQTLHRMTMRYWWDRISSHLDTSHHNS